MLSTWIKLLSVKWIKNGVGSGTLIAINFTVLSSQFYGNFKDEFSRE